MEVRNAGNSSHNSKSKVDHDSKMLDKFYLKWKEFEKFGLFNLAESFRAGDPTHIPPLFHSNGESQKAEILADSVKNHDVG
ncbi:hypothetical protein CDAR_222911 [Caerostris darwini]|uniref:Uncharacterized protein n=1 Tax=Caerostris darwini TaxID=1538125 RepID=A0AAV4RJH8_9ARAC|nr:hypothetical protein CDAR_222911 [Caerostris darwini]